MAIQINGNGTITGISVGGLPDGIVDTDMIAANAVATAKIADSAVTSAKSSGLGGLSMAQQWRQTTGVEPSSSTYTTLLNWEANDAPTGYGSIGSSMTESSGIFTFPSTGIYLIKLSIVLQSANGAKRLNMANIDVTTNNNTYNAAARARASMYGTDAFSSCSTEFIFDVTNVSTHKCRFQLYTVDSQCFTLASTSTWRTGASFLRLGDT